MECVEFYLAVVRAFRLFVIKYFGQLHVALNELPSLIGFFIFLIIVNQLVSGTMLAFSLVTESMYIPMAREEEDLENLYTDDFFWLHERGVDLLVICIFAHLFRKFHFNTCDIEQEFAWKSGVMLYLLTQVVIFLGLLLCCTHLSDVTLTIAVNAFHSFCFFIGKVYWLLFTDKNLNCDTITRAAYLHYVLGFLLGFFGLYHGIDMHYDWKVDVHFDGINQEVVWYDEALLNEAYQLFRLLAMIGILCWWLYVEAEALNYELFMWGDVGMVTDVRFLGVAPHWYFRPYMHWLIACPFHYTGLLGLILFFTSFYFQPNIIGRGEYFAYLLDKTYMTKAYVWAWDKTDDMWHEYGKRLVPIRRLRSDIDWFYNGAFIIFLCSLWYVFSYLPFGRFYNFLGGNNAALLAFVYIFVYMSSTALRVPKRYTFYGLIAY